jgi:hypothetical protein
MAFDDTTELTWTCFAVAAAEDDAVCFKVFAGS